MWPGVAEGKGETTNGGAGPRGEARRVHPPAHAVPARRAVLGLSEPPRARAELPL